MCRFIFEEPQYCLPQLATLFYIITNSVLGFPFFHILTNISYLWSFLITAMLTGVTWYFIVVLICISLMLSNTVYHFMHLLAIYVSGKLFRSSVPFLNQVFVFYIWVVQVKFPFLFFSVHGIQKSYNVAEFQGALPFERQHGEAVRTWIRKLNRLEPRGPSIYLGSWLLRS